jgi:CheY-like chemotaxis protein
MPSPAAPSGESVPAPPTANPAPPPAASADTSTQVAAAAARADSIPVAARAATPPPAAPASDSAPAPTITEPAARPAASADTTTQGAAAAQADPTPVAPPAATPPPAAPTEAPLAAPASSESALTVPEVISVEDDAALAELLEYGLKARGYRYKAYRNGRDALRELLTLDVQGTKPLLLLDVDLPALDGYSILAALQQARPGTYRVVFTTVHGTEEEQLRGLEAGALDYMVKPISLRVALEKIKRWVGR